MYVLCDYIIVTFNNHNNGFYFNGLGRDLATETGVLDEDLWIWPRATGRPPWRPRMRAGGGSREIKRS